MHPSSFDESNGTLDAPKGFDPDVCEPLSIWRGNESKTGAFLQISCWKLTKEELEEFQRTGRVYLIIWGGLHPPVSLTANNPFQS